MNATEATRVISRKEDINRLFNWADPCICKIIDNGFEAEITIRVKGKCDRTLPQNKKQWAMYTDIAKQLTWHGNKMSEEEWKILLCSEWKPQKVIPSISGGFCVLNARTSKSEKKEMADLIEIIYAFGTSNGVVWSEASLKEYKRYKEAQ